MAMLVIAQRARLSLVRRTIFSRRTMIKLYATSSAEMEGLGNGRPHMVPYSVLVGSR